MKNGFNVINVGMLVAGVILVYSGVKGVTPFEVFQQLFMDSKAGKKTLTTPTSPDSSFDKDSPNVGQNRGGGGGGGGGW